MTTLPSNRFEKPTRRGRGLCHAASIAMIALASVLSIAAQTPGTESADSEKLIGEAVGLVEARNYDQAVTKFRKALAQDPDQPTARFQLARLLAVLGRFEEARAEFATVVAAAPQNAAARRGEVTALLLLERYAEARRKLEEGLTALPREGQLAHILARLLATAPDDEVRDGELALRLAQSVYEVKKLYETAETVAMAHAELGQYDEAIELQRGLVAQAESEGDSRQVESLRLRLDSYERSEPWRAASPVEIATATDPPQATQ
jgi:tetratricopeptide (TPR) repeat protein